MTAITTVGTTLVPQPETGAGQVDPLGIQTFSALVQGATTPDASAPGTVAPLVATQPAPSESGPRRVAVQIPATPIRITGVPGNKPAEGATVSAFDIVVNGGKSFDLEFPGLTGQLGFTLPGKVVPLWQRSDAVRINAETGRFYARSPEGTFDHGWYQRVPPVTPEEAGRLLRTAAQQAGGTDAFIADLASKAGQDGAAFDGGPGTIGHAIRNMIGLADQADRMDAIQPGSAEYQALGEADRLIWAARRSWRDPQALERIATGAERAVRIPNGARPAWLDPLTQVGNKELVQATIDAAKEFGIDPLELWVVMAGEGATFFDLPNSTRVTGVDPDGTNRVQSYMAYGLDTWERAGVGGEKPLANRLRERNLLPSDLTWETDHRINEHGDRVNSAIFPTTRSAIRALAATWRMMQDDVKAEYPGRTFSADSLFYNTYLMFNVGPKEYEAFNPNNRGPDASLTASGAGNVNFRDLSRGRFNALMRLLNLEFARDAVSGG